MKISGAARGKCLLFALAIMAGLCFVPRVSPSFDREPPSNQTPDKSDIINNESAQPSPAPSGNLSEEDIIGLTFGVRDEGDAPAVVPDEAADLPAEVSDQAAEDSEAIAEILAGVKDDGPSGAAVVAPALLLNLRYWSNRDYTRVAIEFSREVPFSAPVRLPASPDQGLPPRIYVDFPGTAIDGSLADGGTAGADCFTLPIQDGLLKKARAGQFEADMARVVLDIESIQRFSIFPLPGKTFQFVIDVYGDSAGLPKVANKDGGDGAAESAEAPVEAAKPRSASLPVVDRWARKEVVVMLDAGHGGKDPGAVGQKGLKEKDVTLELIKLVKREIESSRRGVKVVLTRSDDRYLGLVERTAMANTMNADIFVSIHINAAKRKTARGIETYFLDNTTDRAALKLAAKENFVDEAELIDKSGTTNLILADLITASKVEDSVPLAESIQKSLVAGVSRRWKGIPDIGVKKAPFWVLTGATMPCALVEVSFISNRDDEKLLRSSSYKKAAAKGIAGGIVDYLDNYHRPEIGR